MKTVMSSENEKKKQANKCSLHCQLYIKELNNFITQKNLYKPISCIVYNYEKCTHSLVNGDIYELISS